LYYFHLFIHPQLPNDHPQPGRCDLTVSFFCNLAICFSIAQVVIPVKTGVQLTPNQLKQLDITKASLRVRLSPELRKKVFCDFLRDHKN